MKYKVYTSRKSDVSSLVRNSIGKSIVVETASSFYALLSDACAEGIDTADRYDFLKNVFRRAIDQSIVDCQIVFVGMFAKLDYCIKEFGIPHTIADLIQQARKDLFPEHNRKSRLTAEDMQRLFPHNLKAVALLVYYLCGKEEVPAALKSRFPVADRRRTWGKYDNKILRVLVERWDNDYIWAREEENDSVVQICYGADNEYLTRGYAGSWAYLGSVLWEGAQLNLVRVRADERGLVLMPELIVLEPDFLVNVTTIAGCFESYAESPFVSLVKKIQPRSNNRSAHLGNFAGQLLDETVYRRGVSFEDSFQQFRSANMLSMLTCKELQGGILQFKDDAMIQKRNIDNLIGNVLPEHIAGYDADDVMLEPTFFSEVLGIQGRFDFLYESGGDSVIIEQKSGKGDFVPFRTAGYSPDVPVAKEQHLVQLILYRALYQYEFNKYASQLRHLMLLYSKYARGLLLVPQRSDLLLRAMKIRNLIAWSEILYAKEGVDVLKTLTPERLNKKNIRGTLWDRYVRPQLDGLLSPLRSASPLELAYYMRFMRFMENEMLFSKMGSKLKENSGFASIWHDTLAEKQAAGNIYDALIVAGYGVEEGSVESVAFDFGDKDLADTANFRIGDIVMFYPYRKGDVPNACAQMVFRASIADIQERMIVLRLRNSQASSRIFDIHKDDLWAVEHDMYESAAGAIYSGMYSFLSATKRRRDLILLQQEPEVDAEYQIKGEYGDFNTLVRRAKQARDLFLIIGPPGTGKTSFGLVNLLKEELLEPEGSVLLLSYTNRAVDEICSKLLEMRREDESFDFIRIGSELSCSSEYHEYLLRNRLKNADAGAALQLINNTRVFCATTAALNSQMSLFDIKRFSLAIVDESSQILEPHLLGLLSAHKDNLEAIGRFVLIGDHKQLPAVVQQPQDESEVTEQILCDIHLTDCRNSLFERLLQHFKTADGYDERYVYMLTKQGRMHRDIAEFPNLAFYGGKLDIVPLPHQMLPNPSAASGNGIDRLLAAHRIVFVASEFPEKMVSPKTNEVEARMIAATVYRIYLLRKDSFDKSKTVGVIVPYRNQVSTVRNAIDRYGVPLLHDITIDTVERYQGSQRDYILYGFTVQRPYQLNFLTNNVFEEDGLLVDRKLNVAMTRARLNLVMFGNPSLLNANYTFCKLMDYVRQKQGFYEVGCEDYCGGRF